MNINKACIPKSKNTIVLKRKKRIRQLKNEINQHEEKDAFLADCGSGNE